MAHLCTSSTPCLDESKRIYFDVDIILAISITTVITISILVYTIVRYIRNKNRVKWVLEQLLPSFQELNYREAIELIDGRFEATESSLCLEAFEEEEATVTILPGCNHIYCPNCIRQWLLKSTRLPTFPCCPICKSTLFISSSPGS
ncbi:RING-H2 finger protein ATL11 [Linum perenne]